MNELRILAQKSIMKNDGDLVNYIRHVTIVTHIQHKPCAELSPITERSAAEMKKRIFDVLNILREHQNINNYVSLLLIQRHISISRKSIFRSRKRNMV